jgi:hypothetical protein
MLLLACAATLLVQRLEHSLLGTVPLVDGDGLGQLETLLGQGCWYQWRARCSETDKSEAGQPVRKQEGVSASKKLQNKLYFLLWPRSVSARPTICNTYVRAGRPVGGADVQEPIHSFPLPPLPSSHRRL